MKIQIYLILVTLIGGLMSQTTYSTTKSTRNESSTKNESTTKAPDIKLCFEESSGTVRSFSKLADYQGTKFSFNPQHPSYQGNVVEFTFNTIDRLSKNDFISFGSDSIVRMDLHKKGIQYIESEAFQGLFCLHKLDLSWNNISNITEGSFEGLENLKVLDLSHNILVDIPDSGMAFLTLKGLEVLNLSYNNIRILPKLSFMVLYELKKLDLSHNKITTIHMRVFDYLSSLKELYLNDNQLVNTNADNWKDMGNLTDLDLSENYIQRFDTTANYSFFNLNRFNLSGNGLESLNVRGLRKNFPSLKSIDISNNNWLCEDLTVIQHQLLDLRIILPREVNCSEVRITTVKTTTTTTIPSTTVIRTTSKPEVNYGMQLLDKDEKILDSTNKIMESLDSLRSVTVGLFFFVILITIVQAAIKFGLFNSLCGSRGGRSNRGYLDTNDIESVGLISR